MVVAVVLVQGSRHAHLRTVHGSDISEATFIMQVNHHHNHASQMLQIRPQCDCLYLNNGVSVSLLRRHLQEAETACCDMIFHEAATAARTN